MFRNLFGNIPDVTKNLLILNGLFFLATLVFAEQHVDLWNLLGMHYPSSRFFQPYQIITHFFMHANFMHIFFNMFGLVVFGSHLERIWGKKRFFFFYFFTAIGAMVLHTLVQGIELYQITHTFFPDAFAEGGYIYIDNVSNALHLSQAEVYKVYGIVNTNTVGASGAIYGLIFAFAYLFPNTELRLYFAIPVKAKWVAVGLAALEIFSAYERAEGDSVAHFAHLGGMLFAFILVRIWQRDKTKFY